MPDSYRSIAQDAIGSLESEEYITESQFGVGRADEDYHEESKKLADRLKALDAQATQVAVG